MPWYLDYCHFRTSRSLLKLKFVHLQVEHVVLHSNMNGNIIRKHKKFKIDSIHFTESTSNNGYCAFRSSFPANFNTKLMHVEMHLLMINMNNHLNFLLITNATKLISDNIWLNFMEKYLAQRWCKMMAKKHRTYAKWIEIRNRNFRLLSI